jgi:beta-phosphoglucomutase family hydrolase
MNMNRAVISWQAPSHTEALIFDCDGTLADTMPLHYHAWKSTLEQYGLIFTETRFYELGGMPTAKIIQLLAKEQSVEGICVTEVARQKEREFVALMDHVLPLEPVVSVVKAYHGCLPLAVASGGYRTIVHQTLARIGLDQVFDVVVCAEDTVRHKPEPDVFLEAARRLGILRYDRCVVFEDTDLGLEAARRAGMRAVDIRPWLGNRFSGTTDKEK